MWHKYKAKQDNRIKSKCISSQNECNHQLKDNDIEQDLQKCQALG